jgi:hypothetical protein
MDRVRRVAAGLIVVATLIGGCRGGQTYWYCWDAGNPDPHHLGHPVSGDHYCSEQELRDAGM